MHCGGCGYLSEYHRPGTGHCPAPDGGYLKTVTWQDRPPLDRTPWQEIIRRDQLKRAADYAAARAPYVPEVIPPPRVPARAPAGPLEIAGYQGKQALGLGRKAAAAGWQVAAYYAVRNDGEEFCAIKMQRDDLYAVATWTRPASKAGTSSGWAADIAYGVRRGDAPVKLNHTQLEGVITA